MKNVGKDHDKEARKVMQALNLESCADVRISGCSGGEIKRVSIGVELISGPNIIVLDEPTSGLDSTNAIKCIGLLRDLAETSADAPAIVATIHQPNHRIFTDFHKIYLLSRTGQNIYFGSPDQLVSYFNSHALVQPDFSSPADYAIEVASGNYGQEVFDSLSSEQKKMRAIEFEDKLHMTEKSNSLPLKTMKTVPIQKVMSKMRRKRSRRSFSQTGLLCWRSLQASCFKSSQLAFKITVNIVIAILISLLWDKPTGTEDGCWQSGDIREQLLQGVENNMTPREAYMDKITKITANCNLLFSTCVYLILVYSIGTVLVIPLEIKTVAKEISNSWYSVTSYFFAKTISDLPAVTLSILSLEAVCWLATHQVLEGWRFASAFGLSCLMGIICESMGVLIGIILSHDLVSATLVTMASSFPVLMFGGFLIKIADIPWYFKPMTYVSYTRYTFEGILAAVYGFGRCQEGAVGSVDFMKDLTSAQNPLELISTLWTTFNVTREDARVFAPVIGVPQDHLESVINGTIDYLGLDNSGEDVTEVSVSAGSAQASYVMAYFKLEDSILQTSFISLVLIILGIKVLIFYLLSLKTRRVI
jgi:ATP-binding cassette subfamily G (WHITE) protein 1